MDGTRLDLNFTVDQHAPFERHLLRAWTADAGELVVNAHPRRITARGRNRRIDRLAGTFTVTMPPGWTLPVGQPTWILLMLHGRRGACCYCRAKSAVECRIPLEISTDVFYCERNLVAFESDSPVWAIPTNLDPDDVAEFEVGLMRGEPGALVRYADWLWANARGWRRAREVGEAARRVAQEGTR